MPKEGKKINRREFMASVSKGALGAVFAAPILSEIACQVAPVARGKSRLILARNKEIFHAPEEGYVKMFQEMLDKGVMAFIDEPTPQAAWAKLVKPGQKVALKVNGCHRRVEGPTRPEEVDHLIKRITEQGVKEEDISIYERDDRQLTVNGQFTLNKGGPGVQCYSNLPGNRRKDYDYIPERGGYIPKPGTVAEDRFGDKTYKLGDVITRIPRVVEECDVLINFCILRRHSGTAISAALKQHQGSHSNPSYPHKVKDFTLFTDLNLIPPIREKERLIICEGVGRPGSGFRDSQRFGYDGILISTDPVLIDYTAWKLIEELSGQELSPPPSFYLEPCVKAGLGTMDMNKVERIELQLA